MKLATRRNGTRDGQLIIVSRNLKRACDASDIAATMQAALDQWDNVATALEQRSQALESGGVVGSFPFDPRAVSAPLPRAYQWIDGSVYVNHFTLMQAAFSSATSVIFSPTDPLIYQGGSDSFLGATDNIELPDSSAGIDFEAEVAVIVDDVRMGSSVAEAAERIRLIVLVNDVSLRNMIPHELQKGFGFYCAKPASSFSPVAVTPDELGDHWRSGLVHLPMHVEWNGALVGCPNAGEGAGFTFAQLIAHAATTRNLCAGTIVGLGTISNATPSSGVACIAEMRARERLEYGRPKTPYMAFGDHVRLRMVDSEGNSIFGDIDQRVVQVKGRQL